MTPDITLSQALSDPSLFGGTFGTPSFWTWKVVAKLIDGLPLTEPREIDLFEQCTGRKYNRFSPPVSARPPFNARSGPFDLAPPSRMTASADAYLWPPY
jgi:hypothetical protein